MICFKDEGGSERGIDMRDKFLEDSPEGSPSPLTPGGARKVFWIQETAHHYFFLPYSFRLQALVPRNIGSGPYFKLVLNLCRFT